jgi:uncharacterized protein (TIGR02266 family)
MPGPGSPRKTVLIADDTAFVRDRFAAALDQSGHEAVLVDSAAELLACVRRDHAHLDLIVLDLQLPYARGLELVREIRRIDGGRVPIVVFSGTIASAADVRELATLGVAGYVNEYSAAPHILPALAPHLFPDNFNRRSSPRVALSVSVSCRVGNAISSALTLNLSKGGVAIRTMNPLERGTLVRVRFRLPAPSREVEADARVRWTDRNVGMGLQFEQISAADQVAVDEFVDRHFFSNRKA